MQHTHPGDEGARVNKARSDDRDPLEDARLNLRLMIRRERERLGIKPSGGGEGEVSLDWLAVAKTYLVSVAREGKNIKGEGSVRARGL